jgi:hypothetical protein
MMMAEQRKPNDGEMLEELREAAQDTIVQQLRLIHALKGKTGSDPGGCGPTPQSGDGSAPTTTASEFLSDLARVSLHGYEAWLRLSATHFDFLVESVQKLSGKASPAATPPVLQLKACGPIGGEATARFVLENPADVAAEVFLTPLVFRASDGTVLTGHVHIGRVAPDGTGIPGDRVVLFPRECAHLRICVTIFGPRPDLYRAESIVVLCGRVVGRLCVMLDVVRS